MILLVLRIVMLMLLLVSGYSLAYYQNVIPLSEGEALFGALFGLVFGVLVLIFERRIKNVIIPRLIWALIGLVVGLFLARFFSSLLLEFQRFSSFYSPFSLFLSVILGYLGLITGYLHYEFFSIQALSRAIRGGQNDTNFKILDTSVIIDGRIADICETGFIEGTLIIPQFILKELQHIADSSDVLKRNRGRRGLDILQKIQKLADVTVEIVETDFPKIREVDAKLVELGKAIGGKILTNDFNLNKIAELQGIHVLNVNELANALKPVVLPGEVMNVYVLKEGKESGQGVAYLDDGTMVVVDNAINAIGKDVEVSVTSVLQTTAGRMIFSKLKDVVS